MAGLFRRLLGGTSAPDTRSRLVQVTLYEGSESLEVVGESHYQEALWRIVGGLRPEPVRFETHAMLVPEPENDYDANAIAILVAGLKVGYLSREDAAIYRPGLIRLIESCETGLVALVAHVVGGGRRPDRAIGFLGVFLDHDPTDFGLPAHHTSVRTGLSAARQTDLEDDSYDLSWLDRLPADDLAAAAALQTLLASEDEPIDRHYMFCELEHRLYRSRARSASALDEFDAACRNHDAEMDVIRPALLDKFGVVPVIEMYRQAVIRSQKAKLWQSAREWAERGIVIYGNQAARPEVVDDLHKRFVYAAAKLEAASRPRASRPRQTTVAHLAVPQVETLVCGSCGMSFERERTRGRKPKTCPTCRGLTEPVGSA